ncbi:MAG: hypothetical protein LBV27_06675, partial [Oscillospiraceae bacterium]|nr:hypothetical protein [Oscillospiraceae bacterium]
NADTLNRDIRGQVGQLAEMANTGRFSGARQVRTELVSLLNRRQVATAKVDNFSPRIEALEREYAQLEQGTAGERVVSAQAPVSGYFVKGIDGYEQYLSTKVVGQYGMQDYIQAIRGGIDAPQSVSLGKMLTNQIWYFAAAAKRYNTEHVKAGQSVALEFPHLAVKVPAVVTDLLTENKSDDAVILLECNQLSSDIVNLRREDATLHFTDYTGLRINTASLRFQNGQTGVFVLEDNTVRFKKIKPIYEEQGFILSEINIIDTPGYDKEAVSLFDQVISKGIVYDDQPIQ